MKKTLLNLLARVLPSQVIINNCIELIQREQVGIVKYGVSLTDAKLTHEQVLQHLLEEQLDAANYIRKALMTSSQARVDYTMLRRELKTTLSTIAGFRMNSANMDMDEAYGYEQAIQDVIDEFTRMQLRFDSSKVLRDLRQ